MFEWSKDLFDIFYLAFKRRKTVEDLNNRKIAMDTALHANSAFYKTQDGPRTRDNMIKEYSEKVDEIIISIYESRTPEEIAASEVEDPFMAAIDLNTTIVENEEQKNEQAERGERVTRG